MINDKINKYFLESEKEGITFERKSVTCSTLIDETGKNLNKSFKLIQKEDILHPKEVANGIIAFSNKKGGIFVLGMGDLNLNGISEFEGIYSTLNKIRFNDNTPFEKMSNERIKQLNKLIENYERCGHNFIEPKLYPETEKIEIINSSGFLDYLLIFHIEPFDGSVRENKNEEIYLRDGDKSQKLDSASKKAFIKSNQLPASLTGFENEYGTPCTLEDLNLDILSKYRKAEECEEMTFEKLLIAKEMAKRTNDTLALKNCAVLIFAKNPEIWFEKAIVRIKKIHGNEETFGESYNGIEYEFEGPLPKQIDDAKKKLDELLVITAPFGKNGKVKNIFKYPEISYLEPLINGVTHRDYSNNTINIDIKIFDDRLEFFSPGHLPSSLSLEEIHKLSDSNHRKSSDPIRATRNNKIARVLKKLGYIKEYGEGIKRIYSLMDEAGLESPNFEEIKRYLKVTLFNKPNLKQRISNFLSENEEKLGIAKTNERKVILDLISDDIRKFYNIKELEWSENFNYNEKYILTYSILKTNFSRSELVSSLKLKDTTCRSAIKSLIEKNILKSSSSKQGDNNTEYFLIDPRKK